MNPIFLDLGVIQIHWYSVMIFIGLLIGGVLALSEAKKWKIPEDLMINYFFFLVPIALIGARLYYVLFNLDYYSNDWISIFRVWEGGLAIHGGIIAGILWTFFYTKKYKVNFFRMTDIMAVSLIIGQAIGRWGNFFNQEAYGAITTLEALQAQALPKFIIDGMYILGEYRQPTFLYESIGCLIGFIILILIRLKKTLKRGTLTASYLIIYGGLRFVIESMRSDSLMIGPLKIAQLVSICFILIGVIILLLNLRKGKEDKYLYRKDPKEVAIEQIVYFN